MKTLAKTILNPPAGATPITRAELIALGVPAADLDKGESRGEMKTRGPWQIPVNYRALAMSCIWDDSKGYSVTRSQTIYGVRTLSAPRQSGYCLEGRVSVNGVNYRGFTSSQLFKLEDGKLVNIATIHACIPAV